MYSIKINWINDDNDPVFHFETMDEAIIFIGICFDNGYDVLFKKDATEFSE